MTKRTPAPEKIPEWLAMLPKDAMVNAEDFANALGVTKSGLYFRVRKGEAPPQDKKFSEIKNSSCKTNRPPVENAQYSGKVNYWKAVTVRNYIRQLIREEKNGNV